MTTHAILVIVRYGRPAVKVKPKQKKFQKVLDSNNRRCYSIEVVICGNHLFKKSA